MGEILPNRYTLKKQQIHNKITKLAAGFNCNTLNCKCNGKVNMQVNITDRKRKKHG